MMPPFRFTFCCAYLFSWILNDALKVQGSNVKCCFNVLKNDSVSYELSESPGPSCTTTWSVMDVVVVDEYGNMDRNTVVHRQPQKVILKENMARPVTYRQDCLSSGNSYKGSCNDSCGAADVPVEEMSHYLQMIFIIISICILVIIIISTIVCCRRHHASPSNVYSRVKWKSVPKDTTSPQHQV